jgi:hypothetical protein
MLEVNRRRRGLRRITLTIVDIVEGSAANERRVAVAIAGSSER